MSSGFEIPREAPRRPTKHRRQRREPPKAPRVQIHAHRGGAALAPENTMVAFARAVELGVHYLELDVLRCRSGELVVFHDDTLERLVGVPERVRDLSLHELRSVDVGGHFSDDFAGARIPTLIEVLESFRDQVRFNIEIKEPTLRGDGTALGVARLVQRLGLQGDVIASSFNPASLARVRYVEGRLPLGLLYPADGHRLLRRPWAAPILSAYALHPRENLLSAGLVRKAHLRGQAVNVWTVNDEPRIRELAGWRVQGIITDRPDLALQITGALDPLRRPARPLSR